MVKGIKEEGRPPVPPESKSGEALDSALGSAGEALPALGLLHLKPCGWAPQGQHRALQAVSTFC